MRRLLVPLFLIALLFSLVPVVSTPSSLTGTVVRFDPATVELGPYFCVNDTFTLKARVDNAWALFGFSLIIVWNTTYLEYVDHIAKVPVEVYADGLIHEPVMWIKDEVNASEGWYWVAVTTLGGPSFNGSGIAFEITFSVKYQPVDPEPDVNFMVEFIEAELHSPSPIIPDPPENCYVTIYSYPNWNVADINRDLKVDITDMILASEAYGSTPEESNWNPLVDVAPLWNRIDIFDLVTIAYHYGEEYTP